MSTKKRYVIRHPIDGYPNPERHRAFDHDYDAWLEDTATPGRVVHADGGEPEDQSLGRDLSDLVDELNMLASRIAELEAQLKEKGATE